MTFGLDDFYHLLEGNDESISVIHTPCTNQTGVTKAKSNKRKKVDESDDQIVAAIINLAEITKETMSKLIKEMTSDSKIENAMDTVLDTLDTIPELT